LLAAPDALLAHLPVLQLNAPERERFLHGQAVRAAVAAGELRVYGPDFLGLGLADPAGMVQPVRLIASREQ
jgi:hypothetical protein